MRPLDILTPVLEILTPVKVPWKKIRLGGATDGGYILVDHLLQYTTRLVSAGIGYDWNFECEYHRLTGNTVDMFDPIVLPEFASPDMTHHAMKIQCWASGPTDTLFKCDIEGDEYALFGGDLTLEFGPMGMIIEWHALVDSHEEFVEIHEKILERYHIYHVHGNNYDEERLIIDGHEVPNVLEISYIRKGEMYLWPVYDYGPYPTPLDYPNNPFLDDIELTWIRKPE